MGFCASRANGAKARGDGGGGGLQPSKTPGYATVANRPRSWPTCLFKKIIKLLQESLI